MKFEIQNTNHITKTHLAVISEQVLFFSFFFFLLHKLDRQRERTTIKAKWKDKYVVVQS